MPNKKVQTFIMLVTLMSTTFCLIVNACGQQNEAPVQEVFMRGNDIFLRQASGQVVQLTRDGKPKYNVLLSPRKRWVVYNGDPMWSEQAPAAVQFIFTVIDLEDSTRKEIGFSTSRDSMIKRVEWLNPDRFGVLAPFLWAYYYAIFDAKQGKQVDEVLGRVPSVSPDRSKLAYLHIIPHGFPEELTSDFISIIDLTADELQIRQQIHESKATYPERDINKPFSELAGRHFIKSNLLWSSDSRSLAFVENHQKAYWTVVLDLEGQGMTKAAKIRRFKLGTEAELRLREVERFNWEGEERLIIAGTKGIWDPVNQIERVGPKIEWRIDLQTGEVVMREIDGSSN